MPMSQSACPRALAAFLMPTNFFESFGCRLLSAFFTDASSIAEAQYLSTCFDFGSLQVSRTSSMRSWPSRSGSPAPTITSAALTSFLMRSYCFLTPGSVFPSFFLRQVFQVSGRIGRSS